MQYSSTTRTAERCSLLYRNLENPVPATAAAAAAIQQLLCWSKVHDMTSEDNTQDLLVQHQ